MERSVYQRMNEIEAEHWWFRGRRMILAALLARFAPDKPQLRILEAGCGSGGNLAMLQHFGTVDAFEYDADARADAAAKSGLTVPFGALPETLPFEGPYDIIGLFDVLEHIEPDVASLAALATRLAPEGKILLTVPAFAWLWSSHDERHHHFRRYSRASLAKAAAEAGLVLRHASYFNMMLFPVAVLGRAIKRLTGSETPDDQLPAPLLNAALTQVFGAERHLLRWLRLPFGLSLFAVLERR